MSGFSTLVFMSVLLGASSFGMGMLPLSFVFSRELQLGNEKLQVLTRRNAGATMSRLTSFGSGLLLGAGLGIIIPESALPRSIWSAGTKHQSVEVWKQ